MAAEKKEYQLTVGGLAEAAQVGLGTVRYYQKLGLLPKPAKPALGGSRIYTQNDLELLVLIRNAQALGFSLKEVEKVLSHRARKDCQSVKSLIAEKKMSIKSQIRAHESNLKSLKKLFECCGGTCGQGECKLFQGLIDKKLQLAG